MNKKLKRQRRATKVRAVIRNQGAHRITVYRSLNHIYAQLIAPSGKVLTCASSLEKALREQAGSAGNKKTATMVGKLIAERCLAIGVSKIAFDRSGYKYHGRVKALADAAREGGVEF